MAAMLSSSAPVCKPKAAGLSHSQRPAKSGFDQIRVERGFFTAFGRLTPSGDSQCMWFWKRRSFGDDFPEGFRVQRIGIADAIAIAELPPDRIAAYFRRNPAVADRLLLESCDKCYSPSTFITEQGEGYLVGWLSSRSGYQSQRRFSKLADAATDYLLFSLGKGRWTPSDSADSH
jgi:hypothetical protein